MNRKKSIAIDILFSVCQWLHPWSAEHSEWKKHW